MNEQQDLYIKNMVCPRCISAVKDSLERAGAFVEDVQLGHARIKAGPTFSFEQAQKNLREQGFSLLLQADEQLTEQIKVQVQHYLKLTEEQEANLTLSAYLAQELSKNYASLSKHFKKHSGQTIESYFISLRIERVKGLLQEGELNVSQIADKLGYSSVHYLSGQFKKVTGYSVTDYKKEHPQERKSLDKL